MTSNGSRSVRVRTLHGEFDFVLRRLRQGDREEMCFLQTEHLTSTAVKELCLHYATRLSFSEVATLTDRIAGKRLLSEDSVWRLVQQEANRLDSEQQQQIKESINLPLPDFVVVTDEELYSKESDEAIVLTDGISVKAQKPTREKADQPKQVKADKRHETDVMLLPRRDGSFEFVSEGVSGCWSLVDAAGSFLRREWGNTNPLAPLVAITDGAKAIREDLSALFGSGVRIILDWFHLAKRVYENLSMAAHSMKEREVWERQILWHLWQGQVAESIAFLSGLAVRNEKARLMLVGYLEKHASEIIDYGRRHTHILWVPAGKPIGSGRMEKAVDQVIGLRQKDQGMSWTRNGSRALALLKVRELNTRISMVV